ncbi:hypothetical protein V495_03384 [Pseudogymnoascus sp. VKM F-4514 (FW-929)]|nr:hypothetical protein V495_03384 [Pseudogymnoascus sp. VKM F-4514 (FW-929)]KFY51946.1 hypothetical protein V497_08739 [Pseudogymnoascus sp. VKM F-4516 (FW-969)]
MIPRVPSPDYSPLSIGVDFTPLPVYKAASTTSIDFDGLLPAPLQLHEDLKGGCGGQLWPAGMVLSKYMLREHKDDLKDATILELGAGGGLVGLAVALGCNISEPIIITDQINMMPLMEQNIKLNKLESRVTPLVLNWGEPLPDILSSRPATHILAADCVYFEPAFPLLLLTLSELLKACDQAVIYFCFKKRRRADAQFMKAARKLFAIEEIEDQDKAVWSREQLFIDNFTTIDNNFITKKTKMTVTMSDYEDRMLKYAELTATYTQRMAAAAWCSLAVGLAALVATIYFSYREDARKEKNGNQHQHQQHTTPIVSGNMTFSFGPATSERSAQPFQDIGRQPVPPGNAQPPPQVLARGHATISDNMRGGGKGTDNDSSSTSEASPAEDSRPSRLRRRPTRYGSEDVLPSTSSPPPLPDSPMESQLPRGPDAVKRPRSLTDTLHTEGKSGGMEARFAKSKEFMNQYHKKEPANAQYVDDVQSLEGEHSDNESKDSLNGFDARSEPHLKTGVFSRFQKTLKVQQQEEFQDPGLLLDIERIMRRIEGRTPMPLKFKDAVGCKFTFPLDIARTWPAGLPPRRCAWAACSRWTLRFNRPKRRQYSPTGVEICRGAGYGYHYAHVADARAAEASAAEASAAEAAAAAAAAAVEKF